MFLSSKRYKIDGFTMVEMLVVILIIGILSAIAIPKYIAFVSKAKKAQAITVVKNTLIMQAGYGLEHYSYADTFGKLGLAYEDTADYTFKITVTSPRSAEIYAKSRNFLVGDIRGCNNVIYTRNDIVIEGKPWETPASCP